MDLDLAIGTLIALVTFLVPHHQSIPTALCKAVESVAEWEIRGGGEASKQMMWAATAIGAAGLMRSRECAAYTLLWCLIFNMSAMLLTFHVSPFTLAVSASLVLLARPLTSKLASYLPFRSRAPIRSSSASEEACYTYKCHACDFDNGVYVQYCQRCHVLRPANSTIE